MPSPATLLEGGGTTGLRYYRHERAPRSAAFTLAALLGVGLLGAASVAGRSREIAWRLALEEADRLLQDGTCVSSRELRLNVSPSPFVIVRTAREGRSMILLHPEIEGEEGDMIEAVVEDVRCAAPLKVRRRARAVVSFVDGSSALSRLARVRERLRFFQPISLCVQLALGEHPCEQAKVAMEL